MDALKNHHELLIKTTIKQDARPACVDPSLCPVHRITIIASDWSGGVCVSGLHTAAMPRTPSEHFSGKRDDMRNRCCTW